MPVSAVREDSGGRYGISTQGWDTERWVAVLVLMALGLLIAIRMGFRGVDVMGVSAKIS